MEPTERLIEESVPAEDRMLARADELEQVANALDAEAREQEQAAARMRARAEHIRAEALKYRGAAGVIARNAKADV